MYRLCGHWVEAIAAARELVDSFPNDPSGRNLLLGLLMERGEFEAVIREGKKWLRRESNSIGALEALAKGYWLKGDLKAAVHISNRLLSLNPHEMQYRRDRALMYQHLGLWRLAMTDYEQVGRMAADEATICWAHDSVRHLDKLQLRQITQLLFECPLFREDFRRNPVEVLKIRGFALTEDGMSVVRWMESSYSGVEIEAEGGCDSAYVFN